MKPLETRLEEKLKSLLSELNETDFATPDKTIEGLLEQIRAVERKIALQKVTLIVENTNRIHAGRRVVMREIMDLPQPSFDWFTNDMHLHKGKKKQCPEWWAFQEQYNAYFVNYYGNLRIKANHGREEYDWGRKEGDTITPFADFADACKYNKIIPEPLELEEVLFRLKSMNDANDAVRESIRQYDLAKHTADFTQLQDMGLLNQSPTHLYTYNVQFKI